MTVKLKDQYDDFGDSRRLINQDLLINQTLFQFGIFRFEISESFFCNSLAAQCTTASRQWALPIRGQTAELGLSLGPASAPAGLHKSASASVDPAKVGLCSLHL